MKARNPNPRRAELRALSLEVRPLVQMGAYPNVNAAIVAIYAAEVGCDPSAFHSFYHWREAGTPVKKGERGFPVWGQPRRLNSDHSAQADAPAADSADEREFWPVAYLFHAGQVEAVNAQQVAA